MGYKYHCNECLADFDIQDNSPNSVNHCPFCGSGDIEELEELEDE